MRIHEMKTMNLLSVQYNNNRKKVESLEIYLKTLQPFIESSVISARFATDKPTKLMREIWKFTYNLYNFQQFFLLFFSFFFFSLRYRKSSSITTHN